MTAIRSGGSPAYLVICCWITLLMVQAPVSKGQQEPRADQGTRFISTAYHPMEVIYHDGLLPAQDVQPGGAIDQLGEKYLGVTGSGAFFQIISDPATGEFSAARLPLPVPHDPAAFDAAADPVVYRDFYRVVDLKSRPRGEGWQLFVSHHQWKTRENCLVMRVSTLDVDREIRPAADHWRPLYDTRPCLTLDTGNRGRIFAGHESGARMAWKAPGQLLFTTGDQEHDGWNQPRIGSPGGDNDYGKIILLDVDSGAATIYSRGHRNPQGLYVDSDGNIWETEHGPRGGDEVNLVLQDHDYGWPEVTYGTDYGRFVWPPAEERVGDHRGYEQPVYAFVPSIGVSNLIRVEDTQFAAWRGNLLVSSLGRGTMYRLALDGTRVVYAEPLPIDRRTRDLAVGPDGRIWLWGEGGELITLGLAGSQHSGALLFQPCAGCHTTGVTSGGLAPSLFRIVGRKMAVRQDFTYSDSFRGLDGVWSEEQLDAFLADPTGFVPGTSMTGVQITDPEQRRAIIEYLRDLW